MTPPAFRVDRFGDPFGFGVGLSGVPVESAVAALPFEYADYRSSTDRPHADEPRWSHNILGGCTEK